MKKKNKPYLWIAIILSIVLLIVSLVIFPIILDWSWWWFWTPLIIFGASWIVFGLWVIIKILNKNVEALPEINVKDAVDFHKNRFLEDEDMADNVVKKNIELGRYGGTNKDDPTPVLLIEFEGKESNSKIFTITNLNNYKKEFSDKINPTEEELKRLKNIISEHPVSDATETIDKLNPFTGEVFERIKRPIPSSQKARDEIEKNQIEEKTAI